MTAQRTLFDLGSGPTSRQPDASGNAGASTVPEDRRAPPAREAHGAHETPGAPEARGAHGAPGAPEARGAHGAHPAHETSGAHEAPEAANGRTAIPALTNAGVLAGIDRHFGLLLEDLGADDAVALAAATTSAFHRAGHTCLELDLGGVPLVELIERPTGGEEDAADDALESIVLPPRVELEPALRASSLVEVAAERPNVAGGFAKRTDEVRQESAAHRGQPMSPFSAGGVPNVRAADDEARPLVLENGRLYLQRLYAAECSVARRLLELTLNAAPSGGFEAVIERAFGSNDERTEEATAAVRAAVERRLSIVTGGPGTGKTTLVARILAALVGSAAAAPRRIALAAPTGKAAVRLQESVQGRLAGGNILQRVPALAEFPVEARTIHRLLASRTSLIKRLQALIVDECSMVDLPLMARLAGALPEGCRLILLGDANQLSSVEPGSVFSDLCQAGAGPNLGDCVTVLNRNYRFGRESGIGQLAAAVVASDGERALAVLRNPGDAETSVQRLDDEAAFSAFARSVADEWAEHMKGLEADPEAAEAFPARRVLCSHRRGLFGTNRFNHLVERRLTELGRRAGHDAYYVGRPVIVTQNDRQTGLANGDAGVVVPVPDGDGRRVWFPDHDREGKRFLVSTARLPVHESYFALTVHRAQGSEYEEVVFVPGPATSRVNTRELFYTAVTRARRKVTVLANDDSVRAAAERMTSRATGLLHRLR